MHAHRIRLLLDSSALVLLGDPEPLAMEPVVYMPPVYVEAHLDLLPDGKGWHLDGAWLHVALEFCHEFGSKADCKAVGIDTSSC